ncbi:MAG TPA: hypothetical protein VHG92_06450 [Afifellaceae bacterium]|nr:hypothetical protein [Afifellaceae bacterium]
MRSEQRFNISLGLAAGLVALSGIAILTVAPATIAADAAQEPRQAVERAFSVVKESGVLQLNRPHPAEDAPGIQGEAVVRHASRLPGAKALDRLPIETEEARGEHDEIRTAVSVFVWGLSNGIANAVWALAPEMEQDRLGTQQAVMDYFAEGNPPVRHAARMVFDSVSWDEGLPVAEVYIIDQLGLQWRASFGLYRNAAGAWKIISTDITPAPGELI